jgi:hypothetical protein
MVCLSDNHHGHASRDDEARGGLSADAKVDKVGDYSPVRYLAFPQYTDDFMSSLKTQTFTSSLGIPRTRLFKFIYLVLLPT